MNFTNLKRIARYKVRRENIPPDELIDYLKDWWSIKYRLPNNHPLLLEKTFEELFIEYYEDIFKNYPEELNKFEIEVNSENVKELIDDDEKWLKKQMGEGYVAPPEEPKEEESFEDTYSD